MKKKENIENFRDLRMLSIMPLIIMVLDKIEITIIKEKCKNKLTKNQYDARENHNVSTAKIELLLQAKAERLNKALLLDLQKAFDTVKRDELDVQLKIFCENDQILYNMLKHILIIYQSINYDICGTLIEPSTGIPQGSVFGPTLFLIYINETIRQANRTLQNVAIEVFVDDCIIMSNDNSSLQITYDFFNYKINELGMKLNTNKCEVLSEMEQDIIIDKHTKVILNAKSTAKYLGQNINQRGEAASITSLNDKMRKKSIIHDNTKNLSLRARIKIYLIYIRSIFQYLLPLIAFTGKLEETWRNIRKSIFTDILNALSRESGTLLGLSFYNIIIKPIIKMTKRSVEENDSDEKIITFYKETIKQTFLVWLKVEPNNTKETLILIDEFLTNGNLKSLETFDNIIYEEAAKRLYKDGQIPLEIKKLTNVNYKESS